MSATCAWCGKRHYRKSSVGGYSSHCSMNCRVAWSKAGRISREQIEARRAHIAAQPKGCTDIASFLAAGGTIYREPADRMIDTGGVPVFSKHTRMRMGAP